MNKRLLKYKLKSFDYSKINNKAYCKRFHNRLLLNYYWREIKDLSKTLLYAQQRLKANWFNIIAELDLDESIKAHYNIETYDRASLQILMYNNVCETCGSLIRQTLKFCSVKCSSDHKSQDDEYKLRLSKAITKSHANASENDKNIRNANISKSVRSHNSSLSTLEKQEKYSNVIPRYSSFDNLSTRFPMLEFKFDETFYYSNRYLPVVCRKCGTTWEMTKSTTMSRCICRTCFPKSKHKTQTSIFNYISKYVHAKEDDKSVISGELDIYCKSLNFAIEYDGLLPHSFGPSKISYYDKKPINKKYHMSKTDKCEKENIHLFHIFENEYMQKRNIWKSMIDSKLMMSKRIFARKCVVKIVSYKIAKEFVDRTHLQGACNSSVRLGLFYNEELVSLMTFRKHMVHQWEIARFSSNLDTVVTGGASKLLKYFERNYKPKSIISYANRRWSQGNLYEKIGFEFIENTPPNYFYFKINENILYPREMFQKHKLKDKLEIFDPQLTETQNMFNNGYRIIFDAGNKKYLKYY